jgi:PiT family inorganic phosphate transporter
VIVVALGFDFTNGFHDTANAVATSVSTRALTPRMAVLIASVANLAGAFVTTAVAKTIGKDIVSTDLINTRTVLAALLGAIVWNLLTWWFGLPSSSSHALIGGLVGAALAQSGENGVLWHGLAHKVVIPALLAPLIAFAAAFVLLLAIYWVFRKITRGVANRGFRLGQLVSGTFVAFTHGANDAQKTMGVIALALFANGNLKEFEIPVWVKIAAGLSIAAGTYVGGWRIMRTLGQRLYKMEPESGFAAQAAAGATIYAATKYGYPLSTTHVISGAVLGAGSTQRLSAVRWGVAGNIVVAWILTIPAAAGVSALLYWPIQAIFRVTSVARRGPVRRGPVPASWVFSLGLCGNTASRSTTDSPKGGVKPHEHSLDHPDCDSRARAARLLLARALVNPRVGPSRAGYRPPGTCRAAVL